MADTNLLVNNQTLNSSGSVLYRGDPGYISLFINITGPITGTNPTIIFTLQELDPSDETTLIGSPVSTESISIVGAYQLNPVLVKSCRVKISWVISGISPNFDGVFATTVTSNSSSQLSVVGASGGDPITVQFGNPGGSVSLPKIININFNKNDGAIIAQTYKRVATYIVPNSHSGYLIKFSSFQGETSSSRLVAETNMGIYNNNSNSFSSGSNFASPQWASIIQAEVTTSFASGSGNVILTVGYTNETNTPGRTGTITIPKGSIIGSRWNLILQGSDLGVSSIQSISGTPTQVGIVKILALLQLVLHQDHSSTAQNETIYAPGAITFPPGTIVGIEFSGGTVSKTRILDALLQLV